MDCDESEKYILQFIDSYEKADGKAPNLYKKAKKQLDVYELELLDNMAAQSRIRWLQQQKDRLNRIKQNKILVKDQVKVKDILAIGQDIDQRFNAMHKDIEQGIQVSTYIRLELEKQIQALDNMQDQNKQFKKRIKKVKKGLTVIIRRAMLNKCTRFLMVLVILAVLGLIVVTILVDNRVINIKKN